MGSSRTASASSGVLSATCSRRLAFFQSLAPCTIRALAVLMKRIAASASFVASAYSARTAATLPTTEVR